MSSAPSPPIKIVVITMAFPPETGAAPSRMYRLCNRLAEAGNEVEVITAMPNYPTGRIFDGYRGQFTTWDRIGHLRIKRYWVYASNSKSSVKRILSMLSFAAVIFHSLPRLRFNEKPDLVFVQTPPLLVGLGGMILAWLTGGVRVLNVSDLWPLSALDLGAIRKGRVYNLLEIAEKWTYQLSQVVIGQSQETVDYIRGRHPGKKYRLYRNLDQPSPYRESGPAYDPNHFKIIYAGLLGVAQGVLRICQEIDFRALGAEFHIYGGGNEAEALEIYLRDNPNRGITYHGSVPKSEVAGKLSECHATIIPLTSHIRGAFPSKIFMAVAAGLPILFAGDGEGAQTVRERNIGLVSPTSDSHALAANILRYTEMGEEAYERIRQNCIQASRTDFDFERQAVGLVKFVSDLTRANRYV